MKKLILLLLILCVGVMSGCATLPMAPENEDLQAKKFITAPERSVIYLYRNELFGGAIPMVVTVDGQTAGKTNAFTFFRWEVPPGEHTIRSIAENDVSFTLAAKPGKVHFVRQEVKMGMWTARSILYEVNEQEGRQGVNGCKLVKSEAYDSAVYLAKQGAASGGKATPAPGEAASAGTQQGAAPLAAKTGDAAQTPAPVGGALGAPMAEPDEIPKVIVKSGYTLESEPLISSLSKGEFEAAFSHADGIYKKSVHPEGPKQNKFLALLERGKVALAARNYDQCINDLQEAEKRFLTIEGTISISEGLGSLLTDDTGMEYEAEMHEKLLISPYLVLAYLSKGDFDGARVERNRTINKIHQYIEEKPERAYLENPFARLLSAVVYEMEGKHDDARIEYRKMKFEDEVQRLEKRTDAANLIIFVDAGLSPQKYEKKWGPSTIPVGGKTIALGFTYAGFSPIGDAVPNASISINERFVGNTKVLYDLEKTVLAQYESNKADIRTKLVARMTAKAAAQVAAQYAAEQALSKVPFASLFTKVVITEASRQWIAAEKADLRSWLTLPKQIHYLRVTDLEPGEHTVVLNVSGKSQVRKIKIEKGKSQVVHFRQI